MDAELRRLLDELRTSEPSGHIELREPILSYGIAAVDPLRDLAVEAPWLGPSIAVWLGKLGRRQTGLRAEVIGALQDIAVEAGDGRTYAAEELRQFGVAPRALRRPRPQPRPRSFHKCPPIHLIRDWTAAHLRSEVEGFAQPHVDDWDAWLAVRHDRRAEVFGVTLRKWQATRPHPMRRTHREAEHAPPYLEDLLDLATGPLRALADVDLRSVRTRTPDQQDALAELWEVFARLTVSGTASCVGITKAVLLVTNGRIGPAFDSNVQTRVGHRPESTIEWLDALGQISEDIAAFEAMNGPLASVVAPRHAHLAVGRIYDMALGPRPHADRRRVVEARARPL